MNRLAVIGFLLCVVSSVALSQSRRVPPSRPNERPQNRPAPTPTPAPAVREAPDSDDSEGFLEVDTRLVTIPVRVLDRRNRFLGGLSQDSFKVFEDNVE